MTLHVACAADSDYAVHSAAMLHSLLAHTSPEELTVHYLHGPGFSSRSRRLLRRMLEEAGATIVFHEVDETPVDGLPVKGPITIASWYRLLVPSVVDADRALWLDSDLIVVDDVAPL